MARSAAPLAPEVRRRLFVAAAGEFGTLGYERASLNRIVDEAGVAKSSVYHHIGNKEALFRELLVFLAEIGEQIPRPVPAELVAGNFWDAVHEALAEFGRTALRYPELRDLGTLLYGPHGATALQRVRVALVDVVVCYLARGQDLGVVRRDLPADLLAALAISVLMSFDAWVLEHDPVAFSVVDSIVPTLRRLLEET